MAYQHVFGVTDLIPKLGGISRQNVYRKKLKHKDYAYLLECSINYFRLLKTIENLGLEEIAKEFGENNGG